MRKDESIGGPVKESAGWRDFRGLLVVLFVTLAISVFFVTESYLTATNTLSANGHWKSSKLNVVRVPGAQNFMTRTQALFRGHLNLGAWLGFHEVTYGEALTPEEVSFRFWLEHETYVLLVLGRERSPYYAIRFSRSPLFRSAFLKIGADGAFHEKHPLACPSLRNGAWNTCRAVFRDDAVSVELNKDAVATLKLPLEFPATIGFRGSMADAYVDDFNVLRADVPGNPVVERFDNRRNAWKVRGALCIAGLLLDMFVYVVCRVFRKPFRESLLHVAMINLLLCVVSGVAFASYVYLVSSLYPKPSPPAATSKGRMTAYYARKAAQDYALEAPPDTTRILFVGSSQTHGCGASTTSAGYVPVLCNRINQHFGATNKFECMNTSIHGRRSSELWHAYKSRWIDYRPAITVINLSNNDKDLESFDKHLRMFVELNQELGIKTLFVLEANSIEDRRNPSALCRHPVMQAVAHEYGVPVVDANAYLAARNDTGLLWWDFVHPSDYGHRLLAECIFDGLLDLLPPANAPRASATSATEKGGTGCIPEVAKPQP